MKEEDIKLREEELDKEEVKEEEPAAEPAEEPKAEETAAEETKAEEPKAGEKPAETAAANGQVYGSWRVTKENNFSKITVTAGTKNGQITSCKIQSEGEQDLLTDEIRNEWAKAITESGSASVAANCPSGSTAPSSSCGT